MSRMAPISFTEERRHCTADQIVLYQRVIDLLNESRIPFMLGGAYAFRHYTGIFRDTKDLDVFLLPADQSRTMRLIQQAGYRVELTAPHWITKAFYRDAMVDFIFGLANGLGQVDASWFEHASHGEFLEREVRLLPVEEMIWSKAFVMDRDRFDGADICHLIRSCGPEGLDWERLLAIFGPHFRVLLSHLVLFGFVYPAERRRIPERVLESLWERLHEENPTPAEETLCRGTLLSRSQYEHDVQENQYHDARLLPHGTLTKRQAAQ